MCIYLIIFFNWTDVDEICHSGAYLFPKQSLGLDIISQCAGFDTQSKPIICGKLESF